MNRAPNSEGHSHGRSNVPADLRDEDGYPVDFALISKLFAASDDGCESCQSTLTAAMINESATVARVVEMAVGEVTETLGFLPDSLHAEGDDPGMTSAPFRTLARALQTGRVNLFGAAENMSVDDRRSAVESAYELLVGILRTIPEGT